MVQVRPEDTNSCLTVLSHAVTMYPERSGRGPRLELPQIAVANKLALSSASFPSTDALILPPILYLWCARDFPTAPCERVLYCAVLVHSCKHGLVILYRFSKHAGAITVADLLGRDEQQPWFPAQSIEEAVKLSSTRLPVR